MRSGYLRWLSGNLLSNLPQAMAPIALTLATVAMHPGFNVGAALVTAMSFSQVVFSVPLGRLGDRIGTRRFLRGVLVARAGLVAVLTGGIALALDPYVLIAVAAASGAATGAIHGAYRALLSEIVPARRLPKALALAATAGEVVFVGGPVLASVLSVPSALAPVGAMAVVLLASAFLVPRAREAHPVRDRHAPRGSIPRVFLVWMAAVLATGSAVALVEVGAVTIAVDLQLEPRLGAVFAVSLCIASVVGGALATWLGPPTRTALVIGMLATTLAGVQCVRVADDVRVAVAGAFLVGIFLAPLMTYYSLAAETLLPARRRTEGFSWMRMSHGIALATTSLAMTMLPVESTAWIVSGLLVAVMVAVPLAGRPPRATTTAGAHEVAHTG